MYEFDPKSGHLIEASPPANGEPITILYSRLSQEDANEGDSNSIINQQEILRKYAESNGFENIRFISDDGYSGTNFQRPGFLEMMSLIKQGRVSTVIVKDQSRIGRDVVEVGILKRTFDEYNVRFIAANDNLDTAKGFDIMSIFRDVINEWYVADTSRKIRAVFRNKGESGERLCFVPPYGYVGDKHHWEVDPEAAEIVRKIFALCVAGRGPLQIAKQLTAEGVLIPTAYAISKGRSVRNNVVEPTKWHQTTVVKILERMEYTGCTVNFKTEKKSYKSKKKLHNAPEKWKIFPDTHEAIIDKETWERVQELRQQRRRNTKTGRRSIFSGLVFCADCGARMHFSTCKNFEPRQEHFRCSNYKSNTGSCSSHFIRNVVLYDMVLAHLQNTLAFVRRHEEEFVQTVMDKSSTEQRKELAQKRRELAQAQRRNTELDTLFQRVYEDNVSGKIDDERFKKLTNGYSAEQKQLSARIEVLQADIQQGEVLTVNVEQFVRSVRKYTRIEELTPTIVNEFIQRIEVHAPDKSSGHRVQEIDIVYNYIGKMPDLSAVPTLSTDAFNVPQFDVVTIRRSA